MTTDLLDIDDIDDIDDIKESSRSSRPKWADDGMTPEEIEAEGIGDEITERPPWADEAESLLSTALAVARHLSRRRVRLSPAAGVIDILPEGS